MARRYLLLSGGAALSASIIGMATPSSAAPEPVSDTFTSYITSVANNAFSDSNGLTFNTGDAISVALSYDGNNLSSTFTATLTDLTTGSYFTLPALDTNTDSVTGPPPDYSFSASDPLEFQSTYTPFTAEFTGSVISGIGTGTLFINVPAESQSQYNQTGNPDETLTVSFVPEPASIGILGLAFAGVVRLRRRISR